MKYTVKDIQCFIITNNRPAMVQQAIQSLLSQTVAGADIYVLDNSTNSQTQNLLQNRADIKYIKTDTNTPNVNFTMAQSLMTAPYAMILHDDDLLHPQYLSLALKALKQVPDITYIGAKNTIFYNDNLQQQYLNPKKLGNSFYLIDSQAAFALGFWDKINSNWSSAIIKTTVYKVADINALQIQYGKMVDLVMLINFMASGNAVIFKDSNAFLYRVHQGQDTKNTATAHTPQQLQSCIKMFYDNSCKSKALARIYFLRAIENINNNFVPRPGTGFDTTQAFINHLHESGLISKGMLFYARRKSNFFIRLLCIPLQIFYKRDVYKKYIKTLK